MSLLFAPPAHLKAELLAHDHAEESARLGRQLWESLAQQPSSTACLSIRPLTTSRQGRLPSLISWASLDESLSPSAISVPRQWLQTHNSIVTQSSQVLITTVEPRPVTEVILFATSLSAFKVANENDSLIDSWCSESRILRVGELIQFNGHPNGITSSEQITFRVDTLEPVLQGYIKKDITRVVVLLSEETDSDPFDIDQVDSEDSPDDVEIDESFLAGSAVASGFPTLSTKSSDGDAKSGSCSRFVHQEPFLCEPLSTSISPDSDDTTLYLKTSDLGKLGLLNSDWGVVTTSSSHCRLVRVVVDDTSVTKSGTLKASPVLLHNICGQDSSESPTQADNAVKLRPSPFGSHRPFIPTARTITVARVASPLSISRQYQHAFLSGLKSYFEGARRLVKQGDLIAVAIDSDSSRWTQEKAEGESGDGELQLAPIDLDGHPNSNGLVFFMITNVEYEILADNSGVDSQDMFLGSRMGELGCFVDPEVTRIVQAGLEHSRIPDVGAYFETDHTSSRSVLDHLTRTAASSLSPSSPFGKLSSMVAASLAKFSQDCSLDLSFLIKGNRGIGKFTTVAWVAYKLGIHLLEVNCYDLIGETDTKTEATLRVRFDQAVNCSPCIIVLRKLSALAQSTQGNDGSGKEPPLTNVLKECIANLQTSWKMTGFPVILVGIASDPSQVPPPILSQFKHEVSIEVPDERARHEILNTLLRNASLASDVSISELATQTAALVAADLVDLVARSKVLALERVLKGRESQTSYVRLAGFDMMACDFDNALGKAREVYSESIGAPKIPTVSWDDVGGLAHVKSDILDTIQLPLEHPELFADGLKKRSGILLYGPPGTGKTLIAKAVATSCSLNFFSVKGPELLNMYIGESEANVRRVFQKARDAKPCVIFFDELDSIAPKRGNHGDSGGVMDRIVSQLLAELDGMASSSAGSDVFVIGATNRPDLLDPALLRPGRFDRMLYLGVSDTHEAQLNILEALTRKFRLDPDLDLRKVAEQCPYNYTGADLYALCSDAMLNAMSRKAMTLETKIDELNKGPRDTRHPYPITPQYYLSELATPEEILVTVTSEDFELALRNLVPSVSQAEMDHYAQVQKRFTQDKGST
ncbi:hypothetical protein EST38_g7753 [Candolleomyces aberdarensis]|uniref:Peroxisomal ATPase PEX6 n=1 Tax=Candolleomyces aberdarensis TaxID=2316362 RepID=A0A4Q2DEB9_9AGAR|nr:hypothetical protein EST38_g7753 [Candolleomyces aberdarensis]